MNSILLKDFLEENKKKYTFKVGAASSFFYIGKWNEKSLEKMKEVDRNYHLFYKKQIKNIIVQIEGLKAKEEKTDKEKNNLLKAEKLLVHYQKYSASRKPFLERPVKDYYLSDLEEDTMIVIVDGLEIGRYWFASEIEADKKGKHEKKGKKKK